MMASSPPDSAGGGGTIPILAITILGILTTVILLASYYIFVMKCFFHTPSPNRRHHFLHHHHHQFSFFSPEPRGLDGRTIRSLPILPFRQGRTNPDCAVCLVEFLPGEKLRLLPTCSHTFHIDCIDTWLQTTASCPLCRASVSSTPFYPVRFDVDEIAAGTGHPLLQHVGSSRDEKAAGLWSPVQPMRRSFSMDSAADRQLWLALQEAARNGRVEGSGRTRRYFFSFGGNGRSSVLPVVGSEV